MKNSSNALYSVAAIRRIEQAAIASLPSGSLMQRAGLAAAKLALGLIPSHSSGAKALVLAGPGNNGGDAFVLASHLFQNGMAVTVLFDAYPEKLPADARGAYAQARQHAIQFSPFSGLPGILEKQWDIVIDGLFGIGLSKAIATPYRELIDAVNRMSCPVLALDVPSGLDADTGTIAGKDGIAIRAAYTITFIGDKPGLHTAHGRDLAGTVHVDDLDIDARFFDAPEIFKNEPKLFSHVLRRRPHNSHKGSYGNVAIIGGAQGMHGAAILSGRSALHLGAGRVFVGFLEQAPAYDSMQPELMCRAAASMEPDDATIVIGPGLGTSPQALEQLAKTCSSSSPLVMDADALNLLATRSDLQHVLAQRGGHTILTPHPLEAARLLSTTAAGIQADRLQAGRELARRFNAVIVLKGSGTVIARPDGKTAINVTGNPALATAGTGDVLAGMCGALLAQSCPAWEAALAAVWIHGLAADRLVERGCGPIGVAAGELIPVAREVLNGLINGMPNA
ncbi:NAD(P)H-hydrate dehydratase [Oxalobacteraceae bacterium R-40]|uniref:Bifunctional NAD(P)H-hydrate repair enzyme n=1 Tax=Keguizhuia sedimenti TaxID=3064264 RepID=A0ABU1BQ58_9BURK|nr:NAD(P)H-hydrate dehydratase [Oxalobacteraceae bacterium R-40]